MTTSQNLFPDVVKSGGLRPGNSSICVGVYHDNKSTYPVCYYSELSGKAYRITTTSRDFKGDIDITYVEESGTQQTINVNPRMRVFGYLDSIYTRVIECEGT